MVRVFLLARNHLGEMLIVAKRGRVEDKKKIADLVFGASDAMLSLGSQAVRTWEERGACR